MARNTLNPLTGSSTVRRRRNRGATSTTNGDRTMIKYSAIAENFNKQHDNGGVFGRVYIPGNKGGFPGTPVGPATVANYATGVFKPGTMLRWEPSISPTVGGRVFVGFTDNPETMVTLNYWYSTYLAATTTANQTAAWNEFVGIVKGLGTMVSFPAWHEWQCQLPTKLRKKRFDVNKSANGNDVNELDRCAQIAVFACADGEALSSGSSYGSFWYHDVVEVEGLGSGGST